MKHKGCEGLDECGLQRCYMSAAFLNSLNLRYSLIPIYVFFIADIRYVEIELMNETYSEASKVEVCALLNFFQGFCSDNTYYTVGLSVLRNPGL